MSESNQKPRVLNNYKMLSREKGVYIGRPSKWSNPYVMGKTVTRDQACDYFEKFVEDNPQFKQAIEDELKGQNVICFCAPHRCHGDTLIRIANE